MNKPVDERLERELDQMFKEIPAPSGRRDRAMFVAGAAARKPKPLWQRALVPVMGIAVVFVSLSVASLKAAPGQPLWSVRNVLNSVGIAPPVEIVGKSIRDAEADVEQADDALDRSDFLRAERLADSALIRVGEARVLLDDLFGEQREDFAKDLEDIRDDVSDLREDIDEEQLEQREERTEGESGSDDDSSSDDDSDDSSGPGSGDDSDDDSSGSSSGDSSGKGSGGSGSDDSSGKGSGDD